MNVSLQRVFFLNASAILALVVTAIWASLEKPKFVIRVIALIALTQGIIAVAQFAEVGNIWSVPESVNAIFGDRNAAALYEDKYFDGRVRGTNVHVHKFNAMQGMVAIFIFVTAFLSARKKVNLKGNWFLWLVSPFALLGMILTFSRSTIFGSIFSISMAAIKTRGIKPLVFFTATCLAIYFFTGALSLDEAKESNRLLDFSMKSDTNASRLHHLKYAMKTFAQSPLMGRSEKDGTIGPIHSVLLRIVVDYGLMGMVPYLTVIFGIYFILFKYRKLGKCQDTLAWAGLCSFTVAMIDAWTHSSGLLVRDVTQPVLVGVFIGVLFAQFENHKKTFTTF